MIEYLSGSVKLKTESGVVLDIDGVGYGLDLTLPTLYDLPEKDGKVELWIYTRVREDAIKLYGFEKREERDTFEILLQISGIGPKVGLAILSTYDLSTLISITHNQDVKALEVVPGIGKRTAEKVLIELKGKVDRLSKKASLHIESGHDLWGSDTSSKGEDARKKMADVRRDLLSALVNLGFKEKDVSSKLSKVLEQNKDEPFSDLLKKLLVNLRGHGKHGSESSHVPKKKSKEQDLNKIF